VFRGGTASGIVVSSGGTLELFGSATAITNAFGSIIEIGTGDNGTNFTIGGGGELVVSSGSSASGTVVSSGGLEIVFGHDSNATVLSSGQIVISSGGTASNTIVASGGLATVAAGGTETAATISSGGYETVNSGGTISGAVISGGTLEIASGGSANGGTVTFASGGTLKLDSSVNFGGTISGFGLPDHLDLSDIAFGANTTLGFSEASNNLSGTLTVSDGIHTAQLTLLGQYVAAQFTSASDGFGGTSIGDPPLAAMASANPVATIAQQHPT
jgi:autotransporter passenger strand-loop-strand repeat protein